MNPAEMDKIARDIDTVTKAVSAVPALVTSSPQGAAMALARIAAKYVVDTGGSKQDFINMMDAAWINVRGR
jgi:hypothetical protein